MNIQDWLDEAQSLLDDRCYEQAEDYADDVLDDERATDEQIKKAHAIVFACNNARGYDDWD